MQVNVDFICALAPETPAPKAVLQGDVRDLSGFADESFDAVLLMGALYHLEDAGEREKAVRECIRVLKPGGLLAAAYINRFAQVLFTFSHKKNITPDSFEHFVDFLDNGYRDFFYRASRVKRKDLMKHCGLEKICDIGADGIGYAVSQKLNAPDKESWRNGPSIRAEPVRNRPFRDTASTACISAEKFNGRQPPQKSRNSFTRKGRLFRLFALK